MRIVVAGPKGSGKSSTCQELAKRLGLGMVETDDLIESIYHDASGEELTCREIYKKLGNDAFRQLEQEAVDAADEFDWHVIACGGKTLMNPDSRRTLRRDAILVILHGDSDLLWERAIANGVPPLYQGGDGKDLYKQHLASIDEVLEPYADIRIDSTESPPEKRAEHIAELIAEEMALRGAAGSSFGQQIRVTTFGESHGPAVGVVLDGVAPGLPITREEIQAELDRRRPGQSAVATPRQEADQIHILSGVFEDTTTGAPIAMLVYNKDQQPQKYEALRDIFRPGHADFAFYKKYGLRDHRGGGRSSGRETLARVAAGTFARKLLSQRGVTIVAHTVEIAGIKAQTCDPSLIESNPVRCADPKAADKMTAAILQAKQELDSVGGIVQLDITGLPPGLGDPVFGKLDARLAQAMVSIGAVKGVEFGDGFDMARRHGSQTNDPLTPDGFASNHAGGICGGISTGQTLTLRVAFKPTPSISKEQKTVDKQGREQTIVIGGRHDPCIVPRAVPVVEHMAALVILDACRIQHGLRPDWPHA